MAFSVTDMNRRKKATRKIYERFYPSDEARARVADAAVSV
jgi:hypothetical protein